MSFLERLERAGKFLDNVTPLFVVILAIIVAIWLGLQMRKRGMHRQQILRVVGRFFWKLFPEGIKKAFEEAEEEKDAGKGDDSKKSTTMKEEG